MRAPEFWTISSQKLSLDVEHFPTYPSEPWTSLHSLSVKELPGSFCKLSLKVIKLLQLHKSHKHMYLYPPSVTMCPHPVVYRFSHKVLYFPSLFGPDATDGKAFSCLTVPAKPLSAVLIPCESSSPRRSNTLSTVWHQQWPHTAPCCDPTLRHRVFSHPSIHCPAQRHAHSTAFCSEHRSWFSSGTTAMKGN